MQKDSNNVVGMSVFKPINLKAIDLNSFDEISIEMFFLFKFGSCVKMICCLFDHFFIRHIDGENSVKMEKADWSKPLNNLGQRIW